MSRSGIKTDFANLALKKAYEENDLNEFKNLHQINKRGCNAITTRVSNTFTTAIQKAILTLIKPKFSI